MLLVQLSKSPILSQREWVYTVQWMFFTEELFTMRVLSLGVQAQLLGVQAHLQETMVLHHTQHV